MEGNNWIKAQRIGLVSSLIRTWPKQKTEDIIANNSLNSLLFEELEDMKLNTFPPWVLSELLRLKDHQIIKELKDLLKEKKPDLAKEHIINKNLAGADGHSIIKNAQIWAIALLKGYIEPRRLIDYGQQLFPDNSWSDLEINQRELDEFIDSVKKLRMIHINIFNKNNGRFASVNKILSLLNKKTYAYQIANILYHNQFCWPLLVLGDPELSISLPIAIEINYDGLNKIRTKFYNGQADNGLDFSKWINNNNLRKARETGYKLWRSKHGHYGGRNNRYSYREMAENMSLTFDFSLAQFIGGKIFENINRDRIFIIGNSADSCLAQAVLDKLLGRFSLGYTAITGEVGESNNYDFEFSKILSPERKLKHVNETNFYSSAVIPSENYKELSNRSFDNINIFFPDKQSKVADIVQSRPWRRHQYVRSPELKWYVHKYLLKRKNNLLGNNRAKTLASFQENINMKIENVIEEIESNKKPVLSLKNISPLQLMSALWYINNIKRKDKFDYDKNYTLTPPKFSWAVIRAIEGEQDEQFWQVFWETIGGSKTSEFQDFVLSHNRGYAISKLEKALNTFNPDENNPDFRSPDLFIIIGNETFENSYEECKKNAQSFDRSFMVSPILKKLSDSKNLKYRGPYEELNDLIGKTRIILLRDKIQPTIIGGDPGFLKLCSREEKEFLRSLCIYRWGFNYTMAKLLAYYTNNSLKDIDIRGIVESLMNKNVIRETNMWYHIPENIRKKLLWELTLDSFLGNHYYAASSFAPYLFKDSHKTLSIPLEKAFNARYLHEARYHLDEIKDKAPKRNSKYYYLAKQAHDKLLKYTDITSKSVLDNLLSQEFNNSAYLLASHILNSDKLKNPHPLTLLSIATAYSNQLILNNDPDENNLREKANQLYKRALKKARSGNIDEKTKGYTEFKIIAEYLLFLKYNFLEKEEIKNLLKEAETLFYEIEFDKVLGLKGINYQVFEEIAANKENHEEAGLLYLEVLNYDIFWVQAAVKGLGAVSYINSPAQIEQIKYVISNKFEKDSLMNELLNPRIIRNLIIDLTYEKEFVAKRWYLGLKELYKTGYTVNNSRITDASKGQAKSIITEIFFFTHFKKYINKFPDQARKNIEKAMTIDSNLPAYSQIRRIDKRRLKHILNKKEPINKMLFESDEKNTFSIKSKPVLLFLTDIMHSEKIWTVKDLELLTRTYNKVLKFIGINLGDKLLKEMEGDIKLSPKVFELLFCSLFEGDMPGAAEKLINFIKPPNKNMYIEKILYTEIKIGIEILSCNWKDALILVENAIRVVSPQKSKIAWLELKILEAICKTVLTDSPYIGELEEILSGINFIFNKSSLVKPIVKGLKNKDLNNKNLNEILGFLIRLSN